MSKLYFNRLHLTVPEGAPKKEFYIDGVKSAAAAGFRDHAYKIIDVEANGDYIMGTLVKYDPHGRGEVLNEKEGKAQKGGTVNSIVAKAIFIIQISESVIAYKEVPNLISKNMFIKMFTDLFHINHEGKAFSFSMTSITEQYSFVEKVSSLKEIKKISLILVPSNPRNADIWKEMDERLRDNNISTYRETQETIRPGGIKLDDITKSKMFMAEDGYGVGTVSGIDDTGSNVNITTKQSNKEIAAILPHHVEASGSLQIITKYLSNMFESISKRTKKA